MAVLALVIGGGFALQFMRKNKDDNDEEDLERDLEIESPPMNENNLTNKPSLGVPCINWGGLDNGHRMKSEISSGRC